MALVRVATNHRLEAIQHMVSVCYSAHVVFEMLWGSLVICESPRIGGGWVAIIVDIIYINSYYKLHFSAFEVILPGSIIS
jgi:hypothetical protein